MLFKKKEEKKQRFISKDGRVVYDRDFLLFEITPTDEELKTFVDFSCEDIKIPSEDTTGEEDEYFEAVLSKTLYNLFLLCDSKSFCLYLDLSSSKIADNKPCIICSFFVGAGYDTLAKKIYFIVNPLFYHEGNSDLNFDINGKYEEIPEITLFQALYEEFVNYAHKANSETSVEG